MFHWFGVVQNTRGDSLPGWQVGLVDLDGVNVMIFSDENNTPIETVSGIPNRAVADDFGNYDFFVPSGTYTLQFFNREGEFQRAQRFIAMYGMDSATAAEAAAGEAEGFADDAAASATLSQAWAEGTLPGGAGTKSAREHAEDAEGFAGDAQSAAQAALAAAGAPPFPNTAAGLAGVDFGETFYVVSGGVGIVYRKDAGPVATEISRFIVNPSADGAAALIGTAGGGTVQDFIDSGAGAISSFAAYGALTPTATALTTVNAALSDVGVGGMIAALAEIDTGATAPTNPGAEILGEKGIYFEGASGGRRLFNKPGRDASLYQWGRENLVRWLEGLRAGETLKVALVGDSNTASFVGVPLQSYLDSLPNVTVTNFAVSGTQIEQWRTATAPYNSNGFSQADVIAFDPDLIVMCWGTNDPVVGGRDAADFSASLAASLTTLRASLGVNACSIALLTPNAMGDTSDRDELWSLQIRPIIRAMAERFDCGFFDKNALFPNSAIDLAAGAMQNKWLDSARVHNATLSINILAAMIAEWLAPRELYARVWDNIPTKAAADLPITYPPGVSIARMSDGAFNGFTLTVNPISTGGHFPLQINWQFGGGAPSSVAIRASRGGSWSPWATIGATADTLQLVGSIAAGYAATGGANGMNTQRNGNLVSLSGVLLRSPAGQVVSATTLCNIATTSHRPIFNIQDAEVVALNAGGTVERLRADVTTAGNVVVRESSTMTDATTVSINLTYRGA